MKNTDFDIVARGQMAPFDRDALQLIRASLKAAGEFRDLALLNGGVDTMLRASDLVRIRVSTVRDHTGKIGWVRGEAEEDSRDRAPGPHRAHTASDLRSLRHGRQMGDRLPVH